MPLSKQEPKVFDVDNALAEDVKLGVQQVFKSFFNEAVELEEQKVTSYHMSESDVSGIVGMVQVRMEGNLAICFPATTIFSLLERIYRKPFSELNAIVQDGVGELTNNIYCHIKKQLNERGYDFQMAIPSVIVGSNHKVYQSHQGKSLVMVFNFNHLKFETVISLQKSGQ